MAPKNLQQASWSVHGNHIDMSAHSVVSLLNVMNFVLLLPAIGNAKDRKFKSSMEYLVIRLLLSCCCSAVHQFDKLFISVVGWIRLQWSRAYNVCLALHVVSNEWRGSIRKRWLRMRSQGEGAGSFRERKHTRSRWRNYQVSNLTFLKKEARCC